MKKRTLKLGISVLMSAVMLTSFTGCSALKNILKPLDGPGMENSQEVSEELPSGSWEKPGEGESDPIFQKGYCVQWGDQLLFRVYDRSSINYNGLFGDFSFDSTLYGTNQLYSFNPKSPEDGVVPFTDDQGYGMLYLVGNDLYSERNAEGDESVCIYKKTLPAEEPVKITDGYFAAFAEDGKHFASYDYDDSYQEIFSIYETGTEVKKLSDIKAVYKDKYLYVVGMDNSHLYMLQESDKEDGLFLLFMFNFDGSYVYLGDVPLNPSEYPSVQDGFSVDDNVLRFNIHIYQGTGHFYTCSYSVECEIPENATPGNASPASKLTVTEYGSAEDPDPMFSQPEILEPFELYTTNDGGGFIRTIQYHESTNDGIFFVTADSHRFPGADIGWRTGYDFLNLHYSFLPAGTGKEIRLKDMFAPGGSLGSLSEMKDPVNEQAPTIYAFLQFIGNPGDTPTTAFYQVAGINGPEVPIDYYNFYSAEFSKDFIWEEPVDDSFEKWKTFTFTQFIDKEKTNKNIYRAALPELGYDGYDCNETLDFEDSLCVHIGFDEDGKINYMRPVIMD